MKEANYTSEYLCTLSFILLYHWQQSQMSIRQQHPSFKDLPVMPQTSSLALPDTSLPFLMNHFEVNTTGRLSGTHEGMKKQLSGWPYLFWGTWNFLFKKSFPPNTNIYLWDLQQNSCSVDILDALKIICCVNSKEWFGASFHRKKDYKIVCLNKTPRLSLEYETVGSIVSAARTRWRVGRQR